MRRCRCRVKRCWPSRYLPLLVDVVVVVVVVVVYRLYAESCFERERPRFMEIVGKSGRGEAAALGES